MEIVKRVSERRISELINVDAMQFCFIPDSGPQKLWVVKRTQKEYRNKEKIVSAFCGDIKKTFDRDQQKMIKWAMRKKNLQAQERAVKSHYHQAIRQKLKSTIRISKQLCKSFWKQIHSSFP